MRALALDIGQKRIGVAASDASGSIAMPVCVMPANEVLGGSRSFRRILEDHEPDILVCGRPKTMHGEDGPQAGRIMQQAQAIAKMYGLPLEFADERLSSAEAKRILRSEGLSEKQMRGKVDMVAASLFLQTWLDAKKTAQVASQPNESEVEPEGTHSSTNYDVALNGPLGRHEQRGN